MAPATPATRDIIVIGGSGGALEALRTVVRKFEPDLPAAVFVVLHVGARSHLVPILAKAGPLPVVAAVSGERFERGKIYVSVPGFHLLLHDGHMLLRRGPRENLARPAVDALFRSAAATFGGRVIGVILSGALTDGTAGLRAIKRCGGLAVVQDPDDALVAGDAAQRAAPCRRRPCLRRSPKSPGCSRRLAREPAGPTPEVPFEIRLEAAIAAQELADMRVDDVLGSLPASPAPNATGPCGRSKMEPCCASDAMSAMLSRPTRFSPRRARKSTGCWGRFSAPTRSAQRWPAAWQSRSGPSERHALADHLETPGARLRRRRRDW